MKGFARQSMRGVVSNIVPLTLSLLVYWPLALSPAFAEVLLAELHNSPPEYIMNADKFTTGLCPDIYDALNKQLIADDIEIFYQRHYFTPFKRLQVNLKNNKAQIFCGAARTPVREVDFTFSEFPLYPVSRVIVARKGEVSASENIVEILRSSADSSIASIRGSAATKYLQNVFNLKHPVEANTVRKALELVSRKRVKFFFYNGHSTRYMMAKIKSNDLEMHIFPYARYNHYMIYNKSLAPDIIAKIDKAIIVLDEKGVLHDIYNSY